MPVWRKGMQWRKRNEAEGGRKRRKPDDEDGRRKRRAASSGRDDELRKETLGKQKTKKKKDMKSPNGPTGRGGGAGGGGGRVALAARLPLPHFAARLRHFLHPRVALGRVFLLLAPFHRRFVALVLGSVTTLSGQLCPRILFPLRSLHSRGRRESIRLAEIGNLGEWRNILGLWQQRTTTAVP